MSKNVANPISFSDIQIDGNLRKRALLNFARFEERQYQPDNVFQDKDYAWPEDMEGRTVLALTLLSPINNTIDLNENEVETKKFQILFS